jgi:hypothetical protein
LAKGSIALAPTKEEKLAGSVFTGIHKKGKKGNKKGNEVNANEN